MQPTTIKICSENVGIINTTFDGSFQRLRYVKGTPRIQFVSVKGKVKYSFIVKQDKEYLVGVSWIKPVILIDKYISFLIKWGESNKLSAINYFCKLNPGDMYRTENFIRGKYGILIPCPKTVQKIIVAPFNSSLYSNCLVNDVWLRRLQNYEQFDEVMKKATIKSFGPVK